MIKLIENEFVVLYLVAESAMMREEWKAASNYMTEAKFMEYQQDKLAQCQEFKPQLMLVDSAEFFMTIAPELQEWVHLTISLPQAQSGLRRVAVIRSADLFSQISFEQMFSEQQSKAFEADYFNTEQDAQEWLGEQFITA